MNLVIISSQMTGIFKQLQSLGMVDAGAVDFLRHPVRIDGMWRCTVRV